MLFMNRYDIDIALQNAEYGNAVLRKAARFLSQLRDETDAHSDGWHSWPKPCRAAKHLMELIAAGGEPIERDLIKALAPIRAFYTRHGNAAGMQWPPAGEC